MSKHYDNWEKLVGAVLKRELLRRLALSPSIRSCSSDDDVSSCSSLRFDHQLVDHKGKKQIQTVLLTIDDASFWERFFPTQDRYREFEFRVKNEEVVFIPVEAREFIIRTEDFGTRYPSSEYMPYCSGPEAVQISASSLIDIGGKISTRMLMSNTIYGVYLVYEPSWLVTANAKNTYADDERKRREGWMEVEIGSFYVDGGAEGEVEARVVERTCCRKGIVAIKGIEFRPLIRVKQL